MQKIKISEFMTLLNIILLYTAHTMPLYFATFAMPTILRAEHTPLRIIGLLGFLMIPWAFKFLWAPWLDRYYKTNWGKRKTWIIPTQGGLVLLLSLLIFIHPNFQAMILIFILFFVSFLAATQDIASGAYVIEQLPTDIRPFGNYAQVIGTAIGSAIGGAFILFCYGYLGFTKSIEIIVLLAIIFLIILFFINENKQTTFIQHNVPSLNHFWKQSHLRRLLYMCLIYRGCEGLIMGMQQPFLVDLHIPVRTIGLVMGFGNLTVGLIAAGIASLLFKRLGGARILIGLGSLRSVAYLSLFLISFFGIHYLPIIFVVVIMNMATRLMEMVTLYTIFMNQCSKNQAATDFSILVCGELIIYMAGMTLSGYLTEYLGYTGLFLAGSLLSIPSVLISTHILRTLKIHKDDKAVQVTPIIGYDALSKN